MNAKKDKQNIAPRPEAFAEVRRLAQHAAKHDNWMDVCADDIIDDVRKREARKDYGQFVGYHREGWEETNHFDHFYRQVIGDLALTEALPFNVGRDQSADGKFWIGGYRNWEAYHYEIFCPLVDAFWETWEDAVGLYSEWKRAKRRRYRDKYNLFTGIYWPGMKR
jgi:hypothetical protein